MSRISDTEFNEVMSRIGKINAGKIPIIIRHEIIMEKSLAEILDSSFEDFNLLIEPFIHLIDGSLLIIRLEEFSNVQGVLIFENSKGEKLTGKVFFYGTKQVLRKALFVLVNENQKTFLIKI